jgi:DNA-binding LytR/AlgR family response regulator
VRAINILLLEDIDSERGRIAALLATQGAKARPFATAAALIDNYAAEPLWPDGVLLDILIATDKHTGIDAARELRGRGFSGPVVFLSSSDGFGPETYEVEACGYLRKPATAKNIAAALAVMARVVNLAKARDDADLTIESHGCLRRILFRDIVYLEASHNNVDIHLASGEVVAVRRTLAAIAEQLLCDARFAQSHRAFIVNLDYVARLNKGEAVMLDGSKVYIARGNAEFKAAFVRWRLKRGEQV